jgi:hypothetical protein
VPLHSDGLDEVKASEPAHLALIAAEHSTAGSHHNELLVALSSRFSGRPAGLRPLVAAVEAIAGEQIEDGAISLERVEPE